MANDRIVKGKAWMAAFAAMTWMGHWVNGQAGSCKKSIAEFVGFGEAGGGEAAGLGAGALPVG